MPTTVQELFARPLIIGASVSAGYAAPSPGQILATRFGADAQTKTIARNGTSLSKLSALLPDSVFKDRTIVIGLDLMFWDSTLRESTPTLSALEHVAHCAQKNGAPFIVGDVPLLMPTMQPAAEKINQALQKLVRRSARVQVLGLDALLKKLLTDGVLTINGKSYSLFDLLPDGLHVNLIASNFLADEILVLARAAL